METPTIKQLSQVTGIKLDFFGNIVQGDSGHPVINFGKHKGAELYKIDRAYIDWILSNDFPESTKGYIKDYLATKVIVGEDYE